MIKTSNICSLRNYTLRKPIGVNFERNENVCKTSALESIGVQLSAEGHSLRDAKEELRQIIESQYSFYETQLAFGAKLEGYATRAYARMKEYIGEKKVKKAA